MYDNTQLRDKIHKVFEECKTNINEELQQRAVEYDFLVTQVAEGTVNGVLENMPQYNLKTSGVLQAMAKAGAGVTDKDVWGEKELQREQAQEQEREAEQAAERSAAPEQQEDDTVAPVQTKAEEPDLLGGGDLWDGGGGGGATTTSSNQNQASDGLDAMFGSDPTPAPAAQQPPPQQQQQQKPASSGDFLDDLWGGGGGGTTQAAPATQTTPSGGGGGGGLDDIWGAPAAAPAQNTQQSSDPFGGLGFAMTEKGLDDSQKAAVQQQYRNLLPQEGGLMFEDSNIQIRIKSEFHGYNGRTVLYFTNKGSQPITEFSSTLTGTPSGLKIHGNAPGGTIGPQQGIQQMLNIECIDTYEKPPSTSLSYMVAGVGKFKYELPLPLVMSKFIEPLRMSSNEQFVSTWRSTAGSLPASIFYTSAAIDVDRTQQMLSSGFRYCVLRAVDNKQENMVACGQWVSRSNPPVPVLCNVESNIRASAVRLTVKSPNDNLANAVAFTIRSVMGVKEL
eukprot:TRINITY_DN67883_c1_g1_i8.p1 TRINITY_DN67883_c1_g1~~TRINITY_DN67883_c1_g1_i8.p1  ORF type:complete len:504 (+),score=149.77 TRINITY_DN67883_c1_g1_i8:565-2076(+)